jgi:ATP-dependent helicase/nuclease subunit A
MPSDQAARVVAIRERERTVVVDAGAGTGKTTLLVERLVSMVAPADDRLTGLPMERLAAITFTRKAAGELRLRIREQFLRHLGEPGLTAPRRDRLRRALGGLDTAAVGTIHAFADRLLRLRPVEAGLSPSYEIVDDAQALARETFEILLHAVENGTLAAELAGTSAASQANEAMVTVLNALGVGLLAESREGTYRDQHGLDALVAGFIGQRDVPPPHATAADFDAAAFRAAADALIDAARNLTGASEGARYLRATAALLASTRGVVEPGLLLSRLRQQLERAPRGAVTLKHTFTGDKAAWEVWKRYRGGLEAALTGPLYRWLATRLARLFPVVVALYEKAKTRREVLDQLDVLVKLRDLLRDDRLVRGEFQGLFDHIFVDEFQDTDPLQAEIVLFLCEREPVAARWDEVTLRPGSLTLVGDLKQSIYRFRRADVAMYDRVRQVIGRGPSLAVTLSVNFRSVPPLVDWLNDRFDRVLGTSPDDRHFDPATGRVFQRRLIAGRDDGKGPAVHVLPLDFDQGRGPSADDYRRLEGEAIGRYLRWLVEGRGIDVRDPLDDSRRPVRYGDIAVLAVTTWRLSLLFPCLDREGIPYASRGGTLFLADPLHRQFLLGLRALADAEDGVAEAALLRPPFFAVDLGDLARERIARLAAQEPSDEAGRRAAEARRLVRELRKQRFVVSPGTTARDLLERTALARATALGPNGAQRLARLREMCLELEHEAALEGLDYDAVTARLRAWVDHPVPLDPPHPVGDEAIQVLTVHQAKGLEFPVVVLWDGRGLWDARLDPGAWHMERDGRGWLMSLHGLTWEEPQGRDLTGTEKAYLDAERRRVIYVAATRARDLLVVPRAGEVPAGRFVCGDLLAETPDGLVQVLAPYGDGRGSDWANALGAASKAVPTDSGGLEADIAAHWRSAAAVSEQPRWLPVGVTALASADAGHTPVSEAEDANVAAAMSAASAGLDLDGAQASQPARSREGRFGSTFGSAVHHALGLVMQGVAPDARAAVVLAAARFGLTERLEEAVADVERTMAALQAEGITAPGGAQLRIEYPVAGAWEGGMLVSGYIDVLAATVDRLDVIDVKTDQPPPGAAAEAYPEYAGQVRAYARLLEAAGMAAGRHVRCGLLFAADGIIRWV